MTRLKQNILSIEEILNGYDAVRQLYAYIPSMSIWRAWEYVAYRRYTLSEPVLIEYIPIVPEMTGRLFLFVDHLWHVPNPPGELCDILYPFFAALPDFPQAFRHVLAGVLRMEQNWSVGSGAVLLGRKKQ